MSKYICGGIIYQNLKDVTKPVFRAKVTPINTYTEKEERPQTTYPHLTKVEKLTKPKV